MEAITSNVVVETLQLTYFDKPILLKAELPNVYSQNNTGQFFCFEGGDNKL